MNKVTNLSLALSIFTIIAVPLCAQTNTVIKARDERAPNLLAPPDKQEAADAALLVKALNLRDAKAVVTALGAYGLSEGTLRAMRDRLTKTPERCILSEEFLKASEVPLGGRATNVQANIQAAAAIGYERPIWPARWPETNWILRCDTELERCAAAPIAVLNVVDDADFIRFSKWYDRYAERLHSIVLNKDLSNAKLDVGEDYDRASQIIGALFQFIKARNPNAFVWLSVVKQDDRSDEKWIKAMPFTPDGIQISNLRQFHSPFAETRRRYIALIGDDLPMMVFGFYGHKEVLQAKGKTLSEAKKLDNSLARQAAMTAALREIGGVSAVIGPDLQRYETYWKSIGYRGVSAHWLLIEAIKNSENAVPINRGDIIDPGVIWLDEFYAAKDFKRMLEISEGLIAKAAPGDMDWTVGKLYQGIALLNQSPPEAQRAAIVLDEILNFDYQSRPGRDHYILGAAKWRMHAASLAGEKSTISEIENAIKNRNFRSDLKAEFLNQSKKTTIAD